MKSKTPFLVMTVLALLVFSLLGAYFIFSFKKSGTIAKIYKDEKLVCSRKSFGIGKKLIL